LRCRTGRRGERVKGSCVSSMAILSKRQREENLHYIPQFHMKRIVRKLGEWKTRKEEVQGVRR